MVPEAGVAKSAKSRVEFRGWGCQGQLSTLNPHPLLKPLTESELWFRARALERDPWVPVPAPSHPLCALNHCGSLSSSVTRP